MTEPLPAASRWADAEWNEPTSQPVGATPTTQPEPTLPTGWPPADQPAAWSEQPAAEAGGDSREASLLLTELLNDPVSAPTPPPAPAEAAPREAEHVPTPGPAQPEPPAPSSMERADAAALLRELSSLGFEEPPRPAPPPPRPAAPPADPPKRKKRGFFGGH